MPSTFPTFPLRNKVYEVDYEWVGEDFVSESGRVLSSSYWTGWRRHFSLTINGLRTGVTAAAPWNAYNERDALLAAYLQMKGTVGNIAMIDPDGGPNITVKFEVPLRIRRRLSGLYQASIELVEVP